MLQEELKNMSREREEAEKTEIDKEESENEVDTVEYRKKKYETCENLRDILGKIDSEIFNGNGVREFEEFKRETFLIFVETVYSKTGKKVDINYIGMEVTDQVRKREKMAKLGEDNAVRKTMESELGKTIHITGFEKCD
ncbi:hypothetical protein HID58_056307 [Brassica napus]|uniref:Uncharacterized protein n=1 Tax=Brassica napus TaxID=3708 RepID=A0ABQ8AN94_BRANA|nr:hypothetical protein HID58_056307 [Brassica napus]